MPKARAWRAGQLLPRFAVMPHTLVDATPASIVLARISILRVECGRAWSRARRAGEDGSMPSRLINAEHWRSRAEEMRTLAKDVTSQEAKESMLGIAAEYDELAKRVEHGEHWRERAEEMRTIAEYATDQDARDTMLRIASEYDQLAKRAEKRSEK
jgi:hypothetical protein